MLSPEIKSILSRVCVLHGCDCYIRMWHDESGAVCEALTDIELFYFNNHTDFIVKSTGYLLLHDK